VHAPTLRISKVTVAKWSLWFTPSFVFTTMCTMLLAEVSELNSTDRYEFVRCILYVLTCSFFRLTFSLRFSSTLPLY